MQGLRKARINKAIAVSLTESLIILLCTTNDDMND